MDNLLKRMKKKALKSKSKFLICAVAFSKKNTILGINFSRPSSNRHCLANHAETGLILSIGGNKIDKFWFAELGDKEIVSQLIHVKDAKILQTDSKSKLKLFQQINLCSYESRSQRCPNSRYK